MSTTETSQRSLCVAPMMAWTDRHCRYLLRLCSPNARLFTEMITTGALLHGPRQRLLALDPVEHPVVIQLGGSNPGELADAARLAEAAGFDEINLNVGCPSPRVKEGRFGACLMREPQLVARCVDTMRTSTRLPVTVKCRLGVDEADSDELLEAFVAELVGAGCEALYLHARKAMLDGLSPAQNREVPPLQPERVYRLKARFPLLPVILNGGVADARAAIAHMSHVDGVMIGRGAYHDPMFLAALDHELFASPLVDVWNVLDQYLVYIEAELARGVRLHDMTRHMLGMLKGLPGARRYRRTLSNAQRLRDNDIGLVIEAVASVAARAA
ncbi:MAG: tRNA dihydrouridine(20/20a) synthase DusA [Gammaproteobacteria bacterium]|nr:tRNA dihydrouridine(20/20a) synthase DusA [Gammaproteobacteria bacterium]